MIPLKEWDRWATILNSKAHLCLNDIKIINSEILLDIAISVLLNAI